MGLKDYGIIALLLLAVSLTASTGWYATQSEKYQGKLDVANERIAELKEVNTANKKVADAKDDIGDVENEVCKENAETVRGVLADRDEQIRDLNTDLEEARQRLKKMQEAGSEEDSGEENNFEGLTDEELVNYYDRRVDRSIAVRLLGHPDNQKGSELRSTAGVVVPTSYVACASTPGLFQWGYQREMEGGLHQGFGSGAVDYAPFTTRMDQVPEQAH